MAEGLRGAGEAVIECAEPGEARGDVAVCWGWRHGLKLQMQGFDVLVMERGHIGDRHAQAACGWNGLGRRARYVTSEEAGDGHGLRFSRQFGQLRQAWKDGGFYALLLGQVPGDTALDGMGAGFDAWTQARVAELRAAGYAVMYRPHPVAVERGHMIRPGHAEPSRGTLDEDLKWAQAAVAFNSTAAVEAVLAGVPTITLDEGAMAWPMASHAIGEPLVRPDRTRWLADLAWTQFSLGEIRSGFAWNRLREIRDGT